VQLVVASLVVLVAGAAACALASRHVRASLTLAASAIIIASLLCVAAAVRVLWLDAPVTDASLLWPLPLGAARLHLDGLSAWFLLTVAVLSISVAIYTHRYMRSERTHGSIGAFAACLCLLVMAMILLLIAADAVLFLLAWEAMTLASFLLVSFRHRRTTVQRAAWLYIIATHLGAALGVIPMFAVLIAHSGSTLFESFRGGAAGMNSATASAAFVLALLGFGTKAGIMPMHVWLPVAHPAAPTPISALLSGIVIKTGIYGILRTITWLPPLPMKVGSLVLSVGVVSGVLGRPRADSHTRGGGGARISATAAQHHRQDQGMVRRPRRTALAPAILRPGQAPSKGSVYSRTTTWVFRAGPIVNLAAVLTITTLVPVFSGDSLFGFTGDVVLVAYLFALGRMFTVLAAMDTGSSFEGMGASREGHVRDHVRAGVVPLVCRHGHRDAATSAQPDGRRGPLQRLARGRPGDAVGRRRAVDRPADRDLPRARG